MLAVVFNIDDEAGMGRRRLGYDDLLAAAAANPDVLIPFGSVDPHKGKLAVREAHEQIAAGVRGFKFHPNTQAFWPNDRECYPIYEVIEEAGLISLFHSGTTGIGAGMPGGGGVHLKYSEPMAVDDVAADFPGMDIILAHPSFPWQDEALAIAVHKPNVYIDLSGWSPKYFPENLIRYTNTLLRHKMLFGSDYPLITPDRWLDDFAKLPIRDEVRPLVLKDNAARLLGPHRLAGPRRQSAHRAPQHVEHQRPLILRNAVHEDLLNLGDGRIGLLEHVQTLPRGSRAQNPPVVGIDDASDKPAPLELTQDLDHRLRRHQRTTRQLRIGQTGAGTQD